MLTQDLFDDADHESDEFAGMTPPADEVKPTLIPFGKYKGKTMAGVVKFDPKYVEWLLRQDFFKKFKHYRILQELSECSKQ